ncbi:MAG: hypothetical protein JKY60_20455 [Kordiimonadaceae bacterium]|nr:hypothetical protein [Kordiimonadaceae bacterium]
MIELTLVIVPAGGGEADYQLPMKLPAVPSIGDYVVVQRDGQVGTEDFIVRRCWWNLTYPDTRPTHHGVKPPSGQLKELFIEVEMATGAFSTDEHKRSAGSDAPKHDASAY